MKLRHLGPGDAGALEAANELFDADVRPGATRRFLDDGNHHVILAYEDDTPAGFVSGVEMTHPDKGTEMFLYELGVAERFQRRGIGTALVEALADLAVGAGVLRDVGAHRRRQRRRPRDVHPVRRHRTFCTR